MMTRAEFDARYQAAHPDYRGRLEDGRRSLVARDPETGATVLVPEPCKHAEQARLYAAEARSAAMRGAVPFARRLARNAVNCAKRSVQFPGRRERPMAEADADLAAAANRYREARRGMSVAMRRVADARQAVQDAERALQTAQETADNAERRVEEQLRALAAVDPDAADDMSLRDGTDYLLR